MALVGLAPPTADGAAQPCQHARRGPVEATSTTDELEHSVHHLTVGVELELACRIVADADGLGAGVALEVLQRTLGEPALAMDVVEHLQLRSRREAIDRLFSNAACGHVVC